MTVILKRNLDKNERYYKLILLKNLFNEYIVERVFGNTSYITPTGRIKNIFNNKDEAKKYLKLILNKKLKKGYKIFKKRNINVYKNS